MVIGIGVRMFGIQAVAGAMRRASAKIEANRTERVREALVLVERTQKTVMRGSRTRANRKGRAVTAPPGVLGVDLSILRDAISFDIWKQGKATVGEVGPQRVPYDHQIDLEKTKFPISALQTTVDDLEAELFGILGEIPEVFT